jgi:pimeloyl-ACP methyl ester carboxylesterase
VLVATGTGSLMVPAHPRVLAKMLTPRRHRDPAYAARIAPEIYGGSMRTNPEIGADLLHATTRAGPKRGYYFQLAAMTGWSSLPFLGLIRQPTLVMGGDDDPIIPVANGRILAAGIPHATLHIYHGGHVELATRPSLLTPLITSFLAAPPHDARRAEQARTGRHPEHQGPRQAADGTAAAPAAQAAVREQAAAS